MSLKDPFYLVKEEVTQSLSNAQALFTSWRRLLRDDSQSDEFTWTQEELRKALQSIEWDVQDLEDTVAIVEDNPGRFQLAPSEIASRKAFIAETKRAVADINEELSSRETRGKLHNDQRAALIGGGGAGAAAAASSSSDPYARAAAAAEEDNEHFVADQAQQQELIMRTQDEELGELGHAVGRLGEIGRQINTELDDQAKLIDDLDADVDKTSGRLRHTMKKLNKLVASAKDKGQMITIILLIIILAILAVFVMQA